MPVTLERVLKRIGGIIGAFLTFAALIDLPLPLKAWLAGLVFLCWVGFEVFTLNRKKKKPNKKDQKKHTRTIRLSMWGVILIILAAAGFKEYVMPEEVGAEAIYYMIVLDASENMNQPLDGGRSKWDTVQDTFQKFFERSHPLSNYGLVLIGGQNPREKSSDSCSAPTVPLIPVVADNGLIFLSDKPSLSNLNEQFQSQYPQGGGSLSRAFFVAENHLETLELEKIKIIVLIANASDTCEGEIDWETLANNIQLVNKAISIHKELILIDTTGNEDVADFAEQLNQNNQAAGISNTNVQVVHNTSELQRAMTVVLDRLGAHADLIPVTGPDRSGFPTQLIEGIETKPTQSSGESGPPELATIVPTKAYTATTKPTFPPRPTRTATSTFTPIPTATQKPTSTPTKDNSSDSKPPPPPVCCKYCGPNSQPCGDSCISLQYECHQPSGCACKK